MEGGRRINRIWLMHSKKSWCGIKPSDQPPPPPDHSTPTNFMEMITKRITIQINSRRFDQVGSHWLADLHWLSLIKALKKMLIMKRAMYHMLHVPELIQLTTIDIVAWQTNKKLRNSTKSLKRDMIRISPTSTEPKSIQQILKKLTISSIRLITPANISKHCGDRHCQTKICQ